MALSYRRLVRQALLAVLSDPTTGFNARLATIASAYGVTAFTVDFTGASRNFVQSHIDAESLEALEDSALIAFPAMAIYTHTVRDTREFNDFTIAGQVTACIDLIYRVRTGVEGINTEDILDAFEAAVFACINDPSVPWVTYGVNFQKDSMARPASIVPLADGWHHVTSIETAFYLTTN
jgi:regulator of RNase E activity RraB